MAFRPTDRITLVFDVQGIRFSDVPSVSNRIERLYGSPTDPTVPRCPIYGGPGITTSFENCLGGESSYGRSSLGVERPDSATASGSPCP